MLEFRFHAPIEVRYSDIDAQGHVNNACYLTYLETARVGYLRNLGLWDGTSFLDIGTIVGDIHIRYLAPVNLTEQIQVDMSIVKIGNKSFTIAYQIVDPITGSVKATAESIMIAYDYHLQSSMPVSAEWREKIGAFEGQDFSAR
jgi:acyl-CoA thioester hydrolase